MAPKAWMKMNSSVVSNSGNALCCALATSSEGLWGLSLTRTAHI